MKKMISLMLAMIMCLSFFACASNTPVETKANEIELTLDNYEQYLDVSAYAGLRKEYEGNSFVIGRSGAYDFITDDFSQNIYGYVYVDGLSQNFNYSNIKIEVEITGKCFHCDLDAKMNENEETLRWSIFEFVATCSKVDITGKGRNNGSDKFALPVGRGVPVLSYAPGVTQYYEDRDFLEYTYKVISISGTVVPA